MKQLSEKHLGNKGFSLAYRFRGTEFIMLENAWEVANKISTYTNETESEQGRGEAGSDMKIYLAQSSIPLTYFLYIVPLLKSSIVNHPNSTGN